ncbi:hypothetical protein J6590_095213 [Homalodisca vitripennis]|nr:hypothetical protein J6590_095213 [Homalodisca vitripennis]
MNTRSLLCSFMERAFPLSVRDRSNLRIDENAFIANTHIVAAIFNQIPNLDKFGDLTCRPKQKRGRHMASVLCAALANASEVQYTEVTPRSQEEGRSGLMELVDCCFSSDSILQQLWRREGERALSLILSDSINK